MTLLVVPGMAVMKSRTLCNISDLCVLELRANLSKEQSHCGCQDISELHLLYQPIRDAVYGATFKCSGCFRILQALHFLWFSTKRFSDSHGLYYIGIWQYKIRRRGDKFRQVSRETIKQNYLGSKCTKV